MVSWDIIIRHWGMDAEQKQYKGSLNLRKEIQEI